MLLRKQKKKTLKSNVLLHQQSLFEKQHLEMLSLKS